MRRAAFLVVAVLGAGACKQAERSPGRPVAIRLIEEHAGAGKLAGGRDLLAGGIARDDRLRRVNLSPGAAPVARTEEGATLIDVVGDRAYLRRPAGAEHEIVAVPLVGEPAVIARIPAGDRYSSPRVLVVDGGAGLVVVEEAALTIHVAGAARSLAIAAPGETIVEAAGNHDAPETFLVVRHMRGERPPGQPGTRFLLVDTRAATVRWQVDHGVALSMADGDAGFVAGGRVLVHMNGNVESFDAATGQALGPRWTDANLHADTILFARDGDRLAYLKQIGTGHNSFADPACQFYYLDDRVLGARGHAEHVHSYPGFCGRGGGAVFVGDELWIAPPDD